MGTEYVAGQQSVYIKFGSTTLQSDYRTFDPAESIDLKDSTAGVDAARTYISGFKDGQASVELVAQTGGSALWSAVAVGTSGTLEWADEGTATGKQRHYCTAIVTNRQRTIPYDDIAILKVDFKFTSEVTDTIY